MGDANQLKRLGILAEKYGFDFCFMTDDLFKRSGLAILPSIGVSTVRIRLGVFLNPYTINPAEQATYLASLDELANGRVVAAVGAGSRDFLEWIGLVQEKPVQTTRDTVVAIRRIMAGASGFEGETIKWTPQAHIRFALNSRKIPIYISGVGDDMLKLMGELGDGAMPYLFPPEHAGYAVPTIISAARGAGRGPNEVDIAGLIWISVSKDGKRVERATKPMIAYYGPHLPQQLLATIGLGRDDFLPILDKRKTDGLEVAGKLVTDDMLRLAVTGDPDGCLERLDHLVRNGVRHISFGPPLGPDPAQAIRLIGQQIIPHLKNTN